jgi:DNA-binding transcriptional MerR regulator
MYTIKGLADLAGITTRTLRYYDQMGILKPATIGENGYRYYDRGNLLTLQQILFFRELDVPLKEIQGLLSRPDFEILPSLRNHQKSIREKIMRYERLLQTIHKSIQDLEGEQHMKPDQMFSGFDEKKYQAEALQRWGDKPQYKESQQKWESYSEDEKESIKRLGGEITRRMITEDPLTKPDDSEVQSAVGEYYHYLNTYFYHCDREFFRGLADMWVQDPRFAVNYERIREDGAEFVRQAVHHYCDQESTT